MAFTFPTNLMPIAFKLLADVSEMMTDADAAFSGQPGSGLKKKAWVMKAAQKAIEDQELIKSDLMTPAQEAAALDTVDKLVEFLFSAVNLAKLFEPPTV